MVAWSLIAFDLFLISSIESSGQFRWDGFSPRRDKCFRLDFFDYLRSDLPSEAKQAKPIFGPHLPAFYENYLRHVERDDANLTRLDNLSESMLGHAISSGDTKLQLEYELDRLLAKEHQVAQNGTVDGAKQNDTSPQGQPQAPDADPPLPSFNEWTKQKLEEQQQTKQQQTEKNGNGNGSIVGPGPGSAIGDGTGTTPLNEPQQHARNYASKECGAKIILVNSQAQHASSVLNEKEPDEYMLNPCNVDQKFFVVELCETVQITRLDLANFELFSSSPKDFRVHVAERYPTTDWTLLGSWTAEDQRKVQNFPVERRIYAKYVKVELLSHYGAEHFCPLSLIRVLGVSVVEEYEAEAAQEQRQLQKQPELEAAGNAIQLDSGDKVDDGPSSCDDADTVDNGIPVKRQALAQTSAELDSGVNNNFIIRQQLLANAKDAVVHLAKGVIDKAQSVFGVAKPSGNDTANSTANSTVDGDPAMQMCEIPKVHISEQWRECLTCDVQADVDRRLCGYVRAFLVKGRPRNQTVLHVANATNTVHTKPLVPKSTNVANGSDSVSKVDQNQTLEAVHNESEKSTMPTAPPAIVVQTTTPVDSSSLPGVAASAKESVFARLNNRIRLLETNISFSGEYLSELSLRYRKEMDDMHRALSNATFLISQHTKATEQRLAQYRTETESLQAELEKLKFLLSEQMDQQRDYEYRTANETKVVRLENAISSVGLWAPLIAALEIALVIGALAYCCRGPAAVDESVLEAIVERRVRRAILEELQKLNRNGVTVNAIGNGHLPKEHSEKFHPTSLDTCEDLQMIMSDQHEDGHSFPPVVQFVSTGPLSATVKLKKKTKKRQQQRPVDPTLTRKSSDQTVDVSSRKEVEVDGTLNDSAAGILFSTSSPEATSWRLVVPNCRKTALPNAQYPKHVRRGSSDRIPLQLLNPRTKRKFHSHNAFELLASTPSSLNQNHSPEKRPRSGRGPS